MKNSSIIIPVLAVVVSVSLLFADMTNAFAASVTFFNTGTTEPRSIARIGNQIAVGNNSVGSDDLLFFSASNPTLSTGTITGCCTDGIYQLSPNSDSSRLYGFGGTNLYEFDIVNYAVLRSVAHLCTITEGITFDADNNNVYCGTSTETIKKFSLNSMTNTFTSTTLNAGATPCVVIVSIEYDSATDTIFASCSGPSRIVASEGITASGTPDFAVTLASVGEISWNTKENNMFACATASTNTLYDYDFGVGFSVLTTYATVTTCGDSPENNQIAYDFDSDRYIFQDNTETIYVADGTDMVSLYQLSTSGGGANGGQVYPFSNDFTYIAFDGSTVPANDFAVFDMTGIALGSSGTDTPDTAGGIDCTLPENAQILICRLGSDPNCNGTVLGCVGDIVLGNSTDDSDSGLIDVICGVGFIDCNANPDIKTNGIGYLLLAVALGIEIGILWVASRGDLRQVPTFIWFIATIAIIAALTLFNWIDPTMLVLGVIVAVALAAAKARGFFGGDSF